MKEFLDYLKSNRNFIYIGIACACFYVLPIILADVFFMDDHFRIFSGSGWGSDAGRPLADVVMRILSLGKVLTPVFPISVLCAAVIVFFAGVIFSLVLFNNDRGILSKLTPFILLTSPFFLENLSYQFDALPMALSVFFAIFPFLYVNQQSKYFFIASVLSLFVTLLFYQTSAMLYPALLVCIFIKENMQGKRFINIRLLLLSLSAFIVAFLIYKIYLALTGFDASRGELMTLSFDNIYQKSKSFNGLLGKLFGSTAYLFCFVLLCYCSQAFSIIYFLLLNL